MQDFLEKDGIHRIKALLPKYKKNVEYKKK